MHIDKKLSRQYAKLPGISKNRAKCWQNAVRNIFYQEDLATGFYVEGFAVTVRGQVIPHGWIELDGKIIDTTPGWYNNPNCESIVYFPARRFAADVARSFFAARPLPTATHWDDPDYADAHKAASIFVLTQINAT